MSGCEIIGPWSWFSVAQLVSVHLVVGVCFVLMAAGCLSLDALARLMSAAAHVSLDT